MNAYTSPGTVVLYRLVTIVYFLIGILELLLLFRFVLRLMGANAYAGFTTFIYGASHPFVAPFQAVFHVSDAVNGGVFEWTTLLAMFVYWIVAVIIVQLFMLGKKVTPPEAAVRLEQEE